MRLVDARAVLDAAFALGEAVGAPPLAVIALDAGGHPVAFGRQDGASLFRFDIARGKAMGALGMGVDTRILAERAQANPVFFGSLSGVTDGAIVFSAGGVLLRDRGGAAVGAVGVSGATPELDEACALAGIAAIAGDQGCRT